MIFKNLTPHALAVLDANGEEAIFLPEGAPARVTVKTVTRPERLNPFDIRACVRTARRRGCDLARQS